MRDLRVMWIGSLGADALEHYENPVRAGLVREAKEHWWSSAVWVTGGSPPRTRASAPPPPSGGCKVQGTLRSWLFVL